MRKKLQKIKYFVSLLSIFYLFKDFWIVRGVPVKTSLGEIEADPDAIAKWVLQKAILVAGAIAFLLMLYGGFLFITSAGDPNKLQEATDVIMSAIAGLLLIIFSVFLLQLIGVTILQL